jgi:hypothetical protein
MQNNIKVLLALGCFSRCQLAATRININPTSNTDGHRYLGPGADNLRELVHHVRLSRLACGASGASQ